MKKLLLILLLSSTAYSQNYLFRSNVLPSANNTWALGNGGSWWDTVYSYIYRGQTYNIGSPSSLTGYAKFFTSSNNYIGSLSSATLSTNRSYTLPDQSGTVLVNGDTGQIRTDINNRIKYTDTTSLVANQWRLNGYLALANAKSMVYVDSTKYHGSPSINTVGTISSGSIGSGFTSISTSYTDAKVTSTTGNGAINISPTTGAVKVNLTKTSIDTVGTVASGTWQGSSISTTYTDAKVTSVAGNGAISISPTTGAVKVNLTKTSIDTVGTVNAGTWQATSVDTAYTNAVSNISTSYPLTVSTSGKTRFLGFGYNTTNLRLTSNNLNTIQDIATSSSPQFTNETLSGNLTINGTGTNTLTGTTKIADGYQLRSNTFTSSYFGGGFLFDYNNAISGQSYGEIDNLRIRQSLSAHFFQKDILKVIGGQVMISNGGELSDSVTTSQTTGIKVKRSDVAANDILQIRDAIIGTGLSIFGEYWVVSSVSLDANGDGTINLTSRSGSNSFKSGTSFARVGNTSSSSRRGFVAVDASSNPFTPYLDVVNGISSVPSTRTPEVNGDSTANTTVVKARLGYLGGITDANFGTLSGWGLYTQNGYFTGTIIGSTIQTSVAPNRYVKITSTGSDSNSIAFYNSSNKFAGSISGGIYDIKAQELDINPASNSYIFFNRPSGSTGSKSTSADFIVNTPTNFVYGAGDTLKSSTVDAWILSRAVNSSSGYRAGQITSTNASSGGATGLLVVAGGTGSAGTVTALNLNAYGGATNRAIDIVAGTIRNQDTYGVSIGNETGSLRFVADGSGGISAYNSSNAYTYLNLSTAMLNSLTASQTVVTDGSKNLASLAYTGGTSFRKNLGLETSDSPTFAGLTVNGADLLDYPLTFNSTGTSAGTGARFIWNTGVATTGNYNHDILAQANGTNIGQIVFNRDGTNGAKLTIGLKTDGGSLSDKVTIGNGGTLTTTGAINGNTTLSTSSSPTFAGMTLTGALSMGTNAITSVGAITASGTGTFTKYGNAIQLLSGNASYYTALAIGRTGTESYLGVAASSDNWFTGTVAGDIILRTDNKNLFLGSYNGGGAAIKIAADNSIYGYGPLSLGSNSLTVGAITASGLTVNGTANLNQSTIFPNGSYYIKIGSAKLFAGDGSTTYYYTQTGGITWRNSADNATLMSLADAGNLTLGSSSGVGTGALYAGGLDATGILYQHGLTTGTTPWRVTVGTGGQWQVGQNCGSGTGDDTWSVYSATWGGSHSSNPILLLKSSDASATFAGAVTANDNITVTSASNKGVILTNSGGGNSWNIISQTTGDLQFTIPSVVDALHIANSGNITANYKLGVGANPSAVIQAYGANGSEMLRREVAHAASITNNPMIQEYQYSNYTASTSQVVVCNLTVDANSVQGIEVRIIGYNTNLTTQIYNVGNFAVRNVAGTLTATTITETVYGNAVGNIMAVGVTNANITVDIKFTPPNTDAMVWHTYVRAVKVRS